MVCGILYDETFCFGNLDVERKEIRSFLVSNCSGFFEMPAVFEYSLAGNLPSGWILDPATGIISGKATEEASGSFSVMISNATDGESVEKTYTYSIVPKPCDILSIQPESLPSRAVTGAFYQQFTLEMERENRLDCRKFAQRSVFGS